MRTKVATHGSMELRAMQRLLTRAVNLAFGLALLYPAVGTACVTFGADQPAVDKVQASWGPGEELMDRHEYARALAEFRSTEKYIPLIHDALIRSCVAEGAQIRIVSASAGSAFLERHAGDVRGAQVAADRAWRSFPQQRHDCP